MSNLTNPAEENLVTLPDLSEERPTSRFLLRRPVWIDIVVFLVLGAIIFLLINASQTISGPRRSDFSIDLSVWALPKYLGWSLFRGFFAYCLSLTFTFVYGYIAAKSRRAEKVMIPILDILQSIPVLGFMPSVLLAMIALFPDSNFGLELTAIIMIFTGQVWNMTLSFYHSLRTIPTELREAADMYGFGWWRRFRKLELPYATIPLVWNSMMGIAGGWFFLTICETFRLGRQDFRLPGIGSYMWEAIEQNNIHAMVYGISAMTFLILAMDQLVWKPIIAWSQKFKHTESVSEPPSSLILDMLRQSAAVEAMGNVVEKIKSSFESSRMRSLDKIKEQKSSRTFSKFIRKVSLFAGILVLIAGLVIFFSGASRITQLLSQVTLNQWSGIWAGAGLTLIRIVLTLILASIWTIPLGIIIGLKPRVAKILQPVILVLASFPAPMIYPLILKLLDIAGISLQFGSVFLLMLGAQWYILFNAVAGASQIPNELNQVADIYQFSDRRRWCRLYLPAVFPSLITGWIAAAGGAWNASIVAEYIHKGGKVLEATGLGAIISAATEQKQLHILAASVMVMAVVVVLINRIFWAPLFRIASEKFSMEK